MKKGYVISDLHLFTDRSNAADYEEGIHEACGQAEFFVLNGDIFDFWWSAFPSTEETLDAASEWLQKLVSRHPHCQFHYIMGNHDDLEVWAQRLKNNLDQLNFNWSPTHITIGSSLFLHGDLPLGGKNPFKRSLRNEKPPPPKFLNSLYNGIVALRAHRLADLINQKRLCVGRIHKALEKYGQNGMKDIKDIYFGHTHTAFTDYEYGDYIFHNTGGAIKGVKKHILATSNE